MMWRLKGSTDNQFVQSDYLSWLANDTSKAMDLVTFSSNFMDLLVFKRLYVRVAVSIFSKARKVPKYQFVCLDVLECERLVPAF